jgi:aminoglycoside 3'-phosphotransferase II
MSSPVAALPARLASLQDRSWTKVTLGKSGAAVWRIEGHGEELFLKTAPVHSLSEMPGEAARLNWLATTPIPAPALRDYFQEGEHDWLLMTAQPGRDLTHFTDQPDTLIAALADSLRQLHALDTATCPFDQALEVKLARGVAHAEAGLVDETDFDTPRLGWTAAAVVDLLRNTRPPAEDLVVCHGDASLPNIMADGTGFSGIIDCGRVGVADRWQDLAIACRSLIYNCGPEHVAPFLATYGAEWDETRYRYYCTLDELF